MTAIAALCPNLKEVQFENVLSNRREDLLSPDELSSLLLSSPNWQKVLS